MGCFLFIFIDPQISQMSQITLKTLRLCARILSTDFTDVSDSSACLVCLLLYLDFTDSVRLSCMSSKTSVRLSHMSQYLLSVCLSAVQK